eukprot:scaffold15665_cov31-Attheya_sp.AAC.1
MTYGTSTGRLYSYRYDVPGTSYQVASRLPAGTSLARSVEKRREDDNHTVSFRRGALGTVLNL